MTRKPLPARRLNKYLPASAYRGYLLVTVLDGSLAIQKDGYHISYAQNETEAKQIINKLLQE